MTRNNASASAAAFNELLEAFQAVMARAEDAQVDDLTAVEQFTWLAANMAFVGETFIWNDPRRPHLVPSSSPYRKRNGDNPDSVNHGTVIDPALIYRIRVEPGDAVYTSVTVYGGSTVGEPTTYVVGHLNNQDVITEPDGSYDLVLSKQPSSGNWIQLTDDAWHVVARDYFTERRSSRRAVWKIEVLGDDGPRHVDNDRTLAERIRAATRYTLSQRVPIPLGRPNTVDPPYAVPTQTTGAAASDAVYARGSFQLAPGEALVLRGRSPSCTFWNLCLWNRYMQTFDYSYERTSVNGTQIVLEADGSWVIVVCDEDPGHPNWVSTVGHREGIVWLRWFLADSVPPPIQTEVVPMRDLARF